MKLPGAHVVALGGSTGIGLAAARKKAMAPYCYIFERRIALPNP